MHKRQDAFPSKLSVITFLSCLAPKPTNVQYESSGISPNIYPFDDSAFIRNASLDNSTYFLIVRALLALNIKGVENFTCKFLL